MRTFISLATCTVLFAGFYASQAIASATPEVNARACGAFGSLFCTSASCCSDLYCSAQSVCLRCRASGAICDDKNVPCCSTGGTNGGPLYCGTNGLCRSCLLHGAFCDALVPCCSGTCNANGICVV
ncbi:hypothetical protein C8R44DRAFT_788459 [Mycena epipterygia]|nr:hypothetical protein C8R44DRAFT_788459 [Mycena epipterygia]